MILYPDMVSWEHLNDLKGNPILMMGKKLSLEKPRIYGGNLE